MSVPAACAGVTIRHELDPPRLFALWPDAAPDFGDAVVATVCAASKGAAVLTFDERFRKAPRRAGLAVHPTRVP